MTTGDIPGWLDQLGFTAQIINDKMYVITEENSAVIYALDLTTLIWITLTPSGPQPSSGFLLNSWIHNEKMYIFDQDCKLFAHNTHTNCWEWPTQQGDSPSFPSEANHFSTVINHDTVFVFGGCKEDESDPCNSLFLLDMDTMRWVKVHGNLPSTVAPSLEMCPRGTLTRISDSEAILLGRSERTPTCWILNMKNAKQLLDPQAIWTRVSLGIENRFNYAPVLEPMRQELWIIGGHVVPPEISGDLGPEVKDVLKISLRVPTLKNIATDKAARFTCTQDTRLMPGNIPDQLREAVLVCKREIIGCEAMCTKAKGCKECYNRRKIRKRRERSYVLSPSQNYGMLCKLKKVGEHNE